MKIRQMPEQIAFRSDTKHRKEWLTGVHFAHPAKLNLSLQLYLYERYTKPGDVVLDPMAGSGTALIGCSLGRHVICVELEAKFVDMMRGNWEKIRQRGPQMGYQMGEAVILQGDARNLEGLLTEHRQEISCILTSPPYAASIAGNGVGCYGKNPEIARLPREYSKSRDNIGNLKSADYLSAMAQVYQQGHKVLKPGGLLIVIIKNFIRQGKEVRLDLDTRQLCERAGFTYVEELHRKLLAQSFWRILYRQKFPGVPLLDTEYILVFRKVG